MSRKPQKRRRDQLHALAVLAVTVAFVTGVAVHVVLVDVVARRLHMNDFGKFYYAARLFLDGRNMYEPNPATFIPVGSEAVQVFQNLNPPHFHLLVLPVSVLPVETAGVIWLGVNLFLLACCAWIITRELRVSATPFGTLVAITAALWSAPLWTLSLTVQLSGVVAVATTLAWRQLRARRPTKVAWCLGLAASIKPFVALAFLPSWLGSRSSGFVTFLLAVLTPFGAGVVVFGVGQYVNWVSAARTVDWAWAAMNASVAGVVSRTLAPSPYFAPLVLAPGLVAPTTIILSTAVVAVAIWTVMRRPPEVRLADPDTDMAILLVSAMLAFPLGWTYYWFIAAGPIAAVTLRWGLSRQKSVVRSGLLGLAAIAVFFPLPATVAGQPSGWATVSIGSVYFWGLASMWLALVLDGASPRPEREPRHLRAR